MLQWPQAFDAVADTLSVLEEIREANQLVDVVTSARDYESMLLTNVRMSRDAGAGTGANFRLELRELRKVQVRIVGAPIPTEIRGATFKPKGVQVSKEVPPAAVPARVSVAKAFVNRALKR